MPISGLGLKSTHRAILSLHSVVAKNYVLAFPTCARGSLECARFTKLTKSASSAACSVPSRNSNMPSTASLTTPMHNQSPLQSVRASQELMSAAQQAALPAQVGARERRMKQAYYSAPLLQFLEALPQTILGHLAAEHPHDLNPLQRNAWVEQITLLQNQLRPRCCGSIRSKRCPIQRLGKML